MIQYSTKSTSIKVTDIVYKDAKTTTEDIEIIPATFKVEVHAQDFDIAATSGAYKIVADRDSNYAELSSAASGPSEQTTLVANNLFIDSNRVVPIGATSVATTASGTVISGTALPTGLENAVVEINFKGADPYTILPRFLYARASSATALTFGLPEFSSIEATSVAAESFTVLNTGVVRNSLPVQIVYATRTGSAMKLFGNFPSYCVGSTIVIPQKTPIVAKKFQNDAQGLSFVVESYDQATGAIVILDTEKKLVAIAQAETNTIISAEITEIATFSKNSQINYRKVGVLGKSSLNISALSPEVNETYRVVQYIAGA